MAGGKLGKLIGVAAVGGAVFALVRKLQGDAAPQFSNHPTVYGGPAAAPAGAASIDAPVAVVADAPIEVEVEVELEQAELPLDVAPAPEAPAPPAGDAAWVEPVEGECPEGYPIKAKLSSGIFHQPGGFSYERTNPDRCYPTAAAAVADGLRPAKR